MYAPRTPLLSLVGSLLILGEILAGDLFPARTAHGVVGHQDNDHRDDEEDQDDGEDRSKPCPQYFQYLQYFSIHSTS